MSDRELDTIRLSTIVESVHAFHSSLNSHWVVEDTLEFWEQL